MFSLAGRVLPEVLQHLCAGNSVCGLVLPGVPPPFHPDAEQVHVLAHTPQHHRRGGHPALLHHFDSGLTVRERPSRRLRKQLSGEGGIGPASSSSIADLLRDAFSTSLVGAADAWVDCTSLHSRVWIALAVPMCGHGTVLSTGLPGGERDGRQAGVHQHPWELLVGRHFDDDGWIR